MAAAAAILFLATTLYQSRVNRLDRLQRSQEELHRAQSMFEDHLERAKDFPERLSQYELRLRSSGAKFSTAEELKRLDVMQRDIEDSRERRELVGTQVLEILRHAEHLDSGISDAADRLRSRIYLERWRAAKSTHDESTANFLANLVRAHDVQGDIASVVDSQRTFSIITDPPGARVDAFVFKRHDSLVSDGRPRQVAVPIHGLVKGNEAGSELLRVKRAAFPLQAEDLVLKVARLGSRDLDSVIHEKLWERRRRAEAGGTWARIWRNGRILDFLLPKGSVLRPTASPCFHGKESFVGITPIADVKIKGGAVLLMIRAEGHEPMRIFVGESTDTKVTATLDLLGRFPPSFTRNRHGSEKEMVVMDREVNIAEFMEFCADEGSDRFRPQIAAGWQRNEEGEFVLPTTVSEDTPVHGITWKAAWAYARWRTRRDRPEGEKWKYILPDWRRWNGYNVAAVSRSYAWGQHFRTDFTKSCFSSEVPILEPALRYPVDETVTGLLDVAGSVSEFCDGWFWKEKEQRPAVGGCWAYGDPAQFKANYVYGIPSNFASALIGFRLAVKEE